jgi:hypothetical protein
METKLNPVLQTIMAVAKKAQKAYCYPSQRRLLVLLAKYHNVHISLRTLNRYLRVLEDEHFFKRIRRHRKGSPTVDPLTGREGPPRILFASTLYKLQGRAFNWVWDRLTQAKGFFCFYRMPKLAQYNCETERYGCHSGQAGRLGALLGSEGGPAGIFNPVNFSPPIPAK